MTNAGLAEGFLIEGDAIAVVERERGTPSNNTSEDDESRAVGIFTTDYSPPS